MKYGLMYPTCLQKFKHNLLYNISYNIKFEVIITLLINFGPLNTKITKKIFSIDMISIQEFSIFVIILVVASSKLN